MNGYAPSTKKSNLPCVFHNEKEGVTFSYTLPNIQGGFLLRKIILIFTTVILMSATPAFAQNCNTQQGDSMWKIAKRYHVLFSDVLRLNKHYPNQNLIHFNDKIEIPNGSEGNSTNQNSSNDDIQSGSDVSSESETSTQANEVLRLVNAERKKQGLTVLTLSNKLTSVANTKAKDMAVNKYFDHNSPTYGSPFQMLQKFGVKYSYAGENIAAGQKTAQEVMNSWMNSSGHRANILNSNYTQLGVGFYAGGQYDTYWVQQFIKP